MLRGLVEYYRGRPKEAIVYLKQADQQLPRSVAVKALLAMAYLTIGRLERYDEMNTPRWSSSSRRSSEDHLFLALYLSELAPDKAFRALDEAPARFRQSPVARLIRAMVQTKVAQMTGSIRGRGTGPRRPPQGGPARPPLGAERAACGLTCWPPTRLVRTMPAGIRP